MAEKMVIKNPVITIDGNNVSAYLSQATLNANIQEQDGTAFGNNASDYEAGLEDNTLALNFKHAAALSASEGVLWPLRGTKVPVVIKFKDDDVGADNPSYSGTLLVGSLPLGGDVGSIMQSSVTWRICSVVTRAVA